MQTVKSTEKKDSSIKLLVMTAMFAALITAATAFVKLPTPFGYTHAGDSVVYLAAVLLPSPLSFAAAGIGGAAADLLSGYAVWAIPTAIIKMLNVLPFVLIRIVLKKKNKDTRAVSAGIVSMLVPSGLITVVGYFAANLLLYDAAAAAAEIPYNMIQATVAAALFIALGTATDAARLKQRWFKT